jgi:hypothetical protein
LAIWGEKERKKETAELASGAGTGPGIDSRGGMVTCQVSFLNFCDVENWPIFHKHNIPALVGKAKKGIM